MNLERLQDPHILLLAISAIMLYAASRAASEALAAAGRGHAFARAVGHSLPIGLVGMAAVWADLDALAVGVVFASSVMCLTLVSGVALLSAPLEGPAEGQSAWGLMLPLGVLCLLAGLLGGVNATVGLGLLVLGGTISWTWGGGEEVPLAQRADADEPPMANRIIMLILATVLAAVAAVAVTWAVSRIGATHRIMSVGTTAGTVIAPLLVLPLVGAASERAYRERSSGSSLSTALATAVLNLCVWLPILSAMRVGREWKNGSLETTSLPIPLGVWRVDTVLLLAVGLMLVPIGLGRWKPGKLEGALLVAAYVLFVAMMATSGWR